jgi:hypothetical protein
MLRAPSRFIAIVPKRDAKHKHVSREQARHVRPEDNPSNDCCGNGSDKNRPCRNIFRVAHERVKLRRSCVCEKFESGIKSLGCPDNGDSDDEPTPIRRRHTKEEAGQEYNTSGYGVYPRVVLTADHPKNSNDCMAEAADAPRKLKRPALGFVLRCSVALHKVWLRGLASQQDPL